MRYVEALRLLQMVRLKHHYTTLYTVCVYVCVRQL